MCDVFEKRVGGIEPFSMLDFQNKLCGILFYSGCQLRCPYCYNGHLADGRADVMVADEVKKFLNERVHKLDGIVFSGGECTVWGEKLIDDIYYTRNLGYEIKIDTNGAAPHLIQKMIDKKIIDYVALDFKCPEYKKELFMKSSKYYYNFKETFKILNNSKIPFEVRTTVHTSILDETDILSILSTLEDWGYKGTYYIQFFFPTEETLGNVPKSMRHFDTDKIKSDTIKIEYRNQEGNPPV